MAFQGEAETVKAFKDAHDKADTDFESTSIHHTLGKGPGQAAAGNHVHSDYGTRLAALEAASGGGGGPSSVPIGTVMQFAGDTAPTDYLICDGSTFDSGDYPGLAGVVGDSFGTHSGTTYYLPDLRSRVPVGLLSSDSDFNDIGKTGGEKSHKLSVAEMPAHNHGGATGNNAHSHSSSFSQGPNLGSTNWFASSAGASGGAVAIGSSVNTHAHGINSQGGDGFHNNMQPYLVLNHIIKAL